MTTHKNGEHKPRHDPRAYARALAAGKTKTEAIRLAGWGPGTDRAAYQAANRFEKHRTVKAVIREEQERWIERQAKKKVSDLWPISLNVLESLLHNPELTPSQQLRAIELVAKLTGNLAPDGQTNVQVLSIGQQARNVLRDLQVDGQVQSSVLDKLEEMTRGTLPADVEVAIDALPPVPPPKPDRIDLIEDPDVRALARAAKESTP